VPPIAEAKRRENFDCLDSILLARNELERQLDGRQFKQALQHYQADRNRHVIRCGSMNLLRPLALVAFAGKLFCSR